MARKAVNRLKRRNRIKKHVRKKVLGTPERPRLCVYRSLTNIYAQAVDDVNSRTLFAVSSRTKSLAGEVNKAKSKTEVASIVGKAAAEEAKKNKVERVVFDRNGFVYHGRVKALAEGAREAGLKF